MPSSPRSDDRRRSSSSSHKSHKSHKKHKKHKSSSSSRHHHKRHRSDEEDHDRGSSTKRERREDEEEEKTPASSEPKQEADAAPQEDEAPDLQVEALEEKIRQRRERIQAWQKQRKAEEEAQAEAEAKATTTSTPSGEQVAGQDQIDWEDDEMDEEAARKKFARSRPAAPMTLDLDAPEDQMIQAADVGGSMDTSEDKPALPAAPAGKPAEAPAKAPLTSSGESNGVGSGAIGGGGSGAAAGAAADDDDDDDEVDPLDAFMSGINQEVAVIKAKDQERAAKGPDQAEAAKRGERVFQNEDALEYSSEEEDGPLFGEGGTANASWSTYQPKQRKELTVPDHSTIDYAPFRKDFYIAVPEIQKMSPEEVAQLRFSRENIKVKGKGCPRPISLWTQCGVSNAMLAVLKSNRYDTPTPIQSQAIPIIMSGRDMIGIAKTGSGKTLAFVLPMFRHIMDQPPLLSTDGPIAVIMTPTRELALQTFHEARKFAKVLKLRVCCVYGGTNISEQIAELKRGAEIIVCTPGRMIDMLTANSGRVTNVRRTTYAVLDEADRMFDMGFEPQVMRILDNIRPDRQTVMFSATFPRQMEALARRILQRPCEVQVGGRSVVSDTIEQHVVVLTEDQKYLKLLELLGHYQAKGSVLVFMDKQNSCDNLLKELMSQGYACLPLHGGIDQEDRDSNIRDFKQGNIPLLIATSVAARGLDVKTLNLVVNYDCPNHYEDYVHRVGRTGRAGRKGTCFTFVTDTQGGYAGDVIRALELAGTEAPENLKQLWTKYKAEHKKKKSKTNGFLGRGFKFNQAEREKKNEIKALTLKAHGLNEEGEELDWDEHERELEDEIEDKVSKLMGKKKSDTDGAAAASGGAAAGDDAGAASEENLDQKHVQAVLTGKSLSDDDALSKRSKAALIAAKINRLKGFKSAGPTPDTKPDEEAEGVFTDELEINDFPQQARLKVTRKEYVAEISEFSGAALTVRGQFYPPGKKPKEDGERKLYLFIESKTQQSIVKARAEIERILREEIHRAETTYQPQTRQQGQIGGRYKVLALTNK